MGCGCWEMWSKACIRRYEDLEFGLEFRLILGVNEEHRVMTYIVYTTSYVTTL